MKAIINCCDQLHGRLEPLRKLMPAKDTCPELISKAGQMGVDLTARYWLYPTTPDPCAYNVWIVEGGFTCVQVLVEDENSLFISIDSSLAKLFSPSVGLKIKRSIRNLILFYSNFLYIKKVSSILEFEESVFKIFF